MQLKQFIEQSVASPGFFKTAPVLAFVYSAQKTAPILFASFLMSHLKQHGSIDSFHVADVSLAQLCSRLETSFLGMEVTYWIKGIDELDKKTHQALFRYLEGYNGPHRVVLFCTNQSLSNSSRISMIELPDHVPTSLIPVLLQLTKRKNLTLEKQLVSLVKTYETLTLDQMCMALEYTKIVSKVDEVAQLVDRMVESEKSLFTLSQYFFAKNSSEFYRLWSTYQDYYPVTFWCVYWSEQLWRAYFTRLYLEKSQYAHAKTVSTRLPFSFMQKDWKKSSLVELKNAHQWMYDLDRAYKNNIETESGIDLFYTKFFLNEFSSGC